MQIISDDALQRRKFWIEEIAKLSGNFGVDATKVEQELSSEIKNGGPQVIVDHLRLCGAIPESYSHDSSEEKLYSKYTDIVLAEAYRAIGLKSLVLTERADVADVEGYAPTFDFVADAKAFRLSRTAKNQKDFKVQAMDNWKHGKPFAMVVAPLYQLPSKSSQIYLQAIARNVCVFSYSHLSFLVRYAIEAGSAPTIELLHTIFKTVGTINPSKSAQEYWTTLNKAMIADSDTSLALWKDEKTAYVEGVRAAKQESLEYLANERRTIMSLSHDQALAMLLKASKIDSRIAVIERTQDNGLFEAV